MVTIFANDNDISLTPGLNQIPKADANGVLSSGLFTALHAKAMLSYPASSVAPTVPAGRLATWMKISWNDGYVERQFWNGIGWLPF